jgi:hypothetical protein
MRLTLSIRLLLVLALLLTSVAAFMPAPAGAAMHACCPEGMAEGAMADMAAPKADTDAPDDTDTCGACPAGSCGAAHVNPAITDCAPGFKGMPQPADGMAARLRALAPVEEQQNSPPPKQ